MDKEEGMCFYTANEYELAKRSSVNSLSECALPPWLGADSTITETCS
jgi:hypothetical protein